MRFATVASAFLFALLEFPSFGAGARTYDTHDYYAVQLHPDTSPRDFASHLGLEYDGPVGILDDHFVFKAPRHSHDIVRDALSSHKRRKRSLESGYSNTVLDSVRLNQKQTLSKRLEKRGPMPAAELDSRQAPASTQPNGAGAVPVTAEEQAKYDVAKLLEIQDPMFHEQWHHMNYINPGQDLNITGVWMQGITGKNSTVCIIDDGLDINSPDLRANYFAEGSYDFNDQADDPIPRLSDDTHGTRCAGEVAAIRNDVCGVGVAYDARIAGVRILSKPISDVDEAEAMTYEFQKNDIYSCSWGPPDDGREMGRPALLIRRSVQKAVQEGRGGKGTVYVFAAGNGASRDDNCNFDGYTNSIYSITVGAVDYQGMHPYYAEKCSANLVVAYSSGSGEAIHTTNVGGCSTSHGGTSAAGPLAAGVYALVLDVRPDLTWRDLQWLTVENAISFETPGERTEYDWQNTTLGKRYSHQYGYGKLDAWKFVEAAKEFESKKPQAYYRSPWQHVRHEIPQGPEGLSTHFTVTADILKKANLERLEHVTVTMNVNHTRRGDISVDLISPSGIISHIATARAQDEAAAGYDDWTFMSVAHWGEPGIGDWTVIVKDTNVNDHTGTLTDWRLNLFGESIDADAAVPMPFEEEGEDDSHDVEDGVASTVSVDHPSTTAPLPDHPTDHPDRPVNQRPSEVSATATPTATVGFDSPISAGDETEHEDDLALPSSGESSQEPAEAPANDSFLPSSFPTFGVSKRTQVWIYGALTLIVLFCVGLALYFYVMRRRAARRLEHEAYDFDRLTDHDSDDDDDGLGGTRGSGAGRGGRGKRRAGELYDAFAEETDDENLFSDHDDDEGHAGGSYRDEKEGSGSGAGASQDEKNRSSDSSSK